ncbi:MAG: aspartate aminotransferase family protein [Thermomicrobiaceae bacterium]|nr:aspartate aminotransferase family protein [Thermomicrobiaceae bacterium]
MVKTAQASGATGTPDLEREALDHVWIHTTEWVRLAEQGGLKVFDRGYGSTLVDIHGKEYLDGISGLWVVNAGHGRAEIGEAMAQQAAKLAYASSASYTTVPAVQLAHVLSELTPGDLNRIFFASGGSEAVESALKIAKQVQAMRGFPKRYKIIARRGSYHGMTHGAMSLTASRNETYFGPFMYGVSYVPSPNRYRNDFGLEGEAGDLMCADYIEQEIENQGPETVAAVIGEPISTSNGVHVPSPKYWQRLREICDKHGVLLIMDEVINGFGRTGKMFATEHFGMQPDLMTMAKGLSSGYAPIAAVAVSDKVFDIFREKKETALGHLLTFGGQAVACAAALKNLEIFAREGLVQQSAEKGEYLLARLNELRHHPTVGDVRGLGLMCGVELVKNKATKEKWGKESQFTKRVDQKLEEKGMVTRVWDILHVAPPLVVTREEIDRIVAIIDEALTEAEAEFASEIAA